MTVSNTTAVVIPTRNRADLAIHAIRSVLAQPLRNIHVIVSDNSTVEMERNVLADFCAGVADSRLIYVRAPKSLPMTEHWEWALEQALRLPDVGYLIYLTDRSMFKPDALARIIEISQNNPDKVVSYDWVTIFDHLKPILVETQHQTGRVVEISASHLLYLSSQSVIPNCLPRMMNCCVPRFVVETIKSRFQNVFASISPDYSFCYRCLEVVDAILYYDWAAFVSYAIPQSNGVGITGISTNATEDFKSNLALSGVPRSFAAPVPAFETMTNYVMHEYCVVQQETASAKFPEVDRSKYLARIAGEIASNQNRQLKREMQALLRAHSYSMPVRAWLSNLRGKLSLRTRMRKLWWGQRPTLSAGAGPFDSVEEAISYAMKPRLNDDPNPHHLRLLRG